MDQRQKLAKQITHYARNAAPSQVAIAKTFAEFLANHPDALDRSNWAGHVTSSAWIVSEDRSKVLLVKHRKLGIWLQPGGHVEPSLDPSTLDAALREAAEETGLRCTPLLRGEIFDLDIHEIPARADAPAHLHYDVRYLMEASDTAALLISEESTDMGWVSLIELLYRPLHPSQRRLVIKALDLFSADHRRIEPVRWGLPVPGAPISAYASG